MNVRMSCHNAKALIEEDNDLWVSIGIEVRPKLLAIPTVPNTMYEASESMDTISRK